MPYAIAVCLALVAYLLSDRDDPTPPRQYGCEQVYRLPPVWRCGEYGTGANNKDVVRTEAWITDARYHVNIGD